MLRVKLGAFTQIVNLNMLQLIWIWIVQLRFVVLVGIGNSSTDLAHASQSCPQTSKCYGRYYFGDAIVGGIA